MEIFAYPPKSQKIPNILIYNYQNSSHAFAIITATILKQAIKFIVHDEWMALNE